MEIGRRGAGTPPIECGRLEEGGPISQCSGEEVLNYGGHASDVAELGDVRTRTGWVVYPAWRDGRPTVLVQAGVGGLRFEAELGKAETRTGNFGRRSQSLVSKKVRSDAPVRKYYTSSPSPPPSPPYPLLYSRRLPIMAVSGLSSGWCPISRVELTPRLSTLAYSPPSPSLSTPPWSRLSLPTRQLSRL